MQPLMESEKTRTTDMQLRHTKLFSDRSAASSGSGSFRKNVLSAGIDTAMMVMAPSAVPRIMTVITRSGTWVSDVAAWPSCGDSLTRRRVWLYHLEDGVDL